MTIHETQETFVPPQGQSVIFAYDEASLQQMTESYERFRKMHEDLEAQQRLAEQRIEEECRTRARKQR